MQIRLIIASFSGNLVATVFTLFAMLLVMRWTPPHQLGLWNLMMVFLSYSSLLQLGVFNAANRQIPFYRGSGDTVKAELAGQVGLAWCLGLTGVTTVIGIIGIAYLAVTGTRDQMLTTATFVVVLACSWSLQFLTVGYSVTGAFGQLARKSTLIAIAGVPLAFLAYLFGYMGLLLRAGMLAVISILALHYQRQFKVRPKWDGAIFRQLVRIGLPIWLLGQLTALFMTLDRLVLSYSPQLLGYYAVAAQIASLAVMVPTAFNSVLYPQMSRSYGEHRLAMGLWHQALHASGGIFVTGMVFAVICWLAIPTFVTSLLPAYAPAIEAACWTSLVAVAMTFSAFGNVLNVLGRQDLYLVGSAIGGVVFFVAWKSLSAVANGFPLVAAAQSMLLATLVTSVCAMIISRILCARLDLKSVSAYKLAKSL